MTPSTTHKDFALGVAEYDLRYRHHCLYRLELSEPYDLIEDWDANKSWPHAGEPGVYSIYDERWTLLYIGKASLNAGMGSRLSAHMPGTSDTPFAVTEADGWGEFVPRYIITVPVEEAFESPSLEEYLIGRLNPPTNTQGTKKED